MVRKLPCNAGGVGSSPYQGTKFPRAMELQSPWTATPEPVCHNQRLRTSKEIPRDTVKVPQVSTKTQRGQINKDFF